MIQRLKNDRTMIQRRNYCTRMQRIRNYTVQECKGLETILYKDTKDKKLLYKDTKDKKLLYKDATDKKLLYHTVLNQNKILPCMMWIKYIR